MNAITPAKPMPPDHSTAASGTLPTEQTKLRTAISGPTIAFSSVRQNDGASVTKSPLKKSLPSSPMKPASTKPSPISRQSIRQSPRKLWATSDQPSNEKTREPLADPCTCPASACIACSRACSSSRRDTNSRSIPHINRIITMPPTYSPSANCQPISTHSTRPSSQTRLVEANWNASADTADAPFWNSDLAIAIAAYEHEDDAAPRPVASATGRAPSPDSDDSIRRRGTHACTIAEIRK